MTQLHAALHVVRLDVDGRRVQAVVNATAHAVEVVFEGQRFVFERPDAFAAHGPAVGEGSLTAPMPGTVLAVDVAQDDRVEEGQRLGVLEAMKMEITLRAPFDGTRDHGRCRGGRAGAARRAALRGGGDPRWLSLSKPTSRTA